MKDFLMFVMAGCPYCRKARAWQEELLEQHPEYRSLPLRIVDENSEAALANSYDYYYVPCYWLGKKKLAEGALTREQVAEVFARVYQESQAKA